MTDSFIYHLVEEARWKTATATGSSGYLAPSCAEDGFIHATKDGSMLLPVANHFYTGENEFFIKGEVQVVLCWLASLPSALAARILVEDSR